MLGGKSSRMCSIMGVRFVEDLYYVVLDRLLTQSNDNADIFTGFTSSNQIEYFNFTWSKRVRDLDDNAFNFARCREFAQQYFGTYIP
mgnify:CR=1 FL=1